MSGVTLKQIEDLLDRKLEEKLEEKLNQKFDEKLRPIYIRLDRIEARIESLENRVSQLSLDILDVKTNVRYLGNMISDMADDIVTHNEFRDLIKLNKLKYA